MNDLHGPTNQDTDENSVGGEGLRKSIEMWFAILCFFFPVCGFAQSNVAWRNFLVMAQIGNPNPSTGVITTPLLISGTFTFTNHNNMYWAGPGPTPTIDSAIASCAGLPNCVVSISPGYTGPDSTSCFTTSTGYKAFTSLNNQVIEDYRANTSTGACFYPLIYGGRSFGALTKLGTTYYTVSPPDSTTAASNVNLVSGILPSNGGALNGAVSLVVSHDSVTVGTANSPWVGQDGECDIQSTTFDGPVNFCFGINGQTNILRANATQNIVNGIGNHAAVNSNASSSGAQIVNSYGFYAESQNAGSARNYGYYNRGNWLTDTETQLHSLITGAAQAITAATEAGQTATITTSGVCAFTTNQEVSIAGVTPAGYNGRYFVLSPGCNGGSTFTYFHPSSSGLAAGSVFGTVSGFTPQTTIYWRNTNSIEYKPLSDNVGWVWLNQAGSGAFRVIPNGAITSFIAHQFSAAMSPASAGGTDVGTAALPFRNSFVNGHLLSTSVLSSTNLSACGTSPTLVGSDSFGTITVGSAGGTSCVLTFGVAWGTAPSCVVSDDSAIVAIQPVSTTTTLTLTGSAALTGAKLTYFCGSIS